MSMSGSLFSLLWTDIFRTGMFVYIAAARDGYFIRDTMNSTTAGFDYGDLVGPFQLFLFLRGIFFALSIPHDAMGGDSSLGDIC